MSCASAHHFFHNFTVAFRKCYPEHAVFRCSDPARHPHSASKERALERQTHTHRHTEKERQTETLRDRQRLNQRQIPRGKNDTIAHERKYNQQQWDGQQQTLKRQRFSFAARKRPSSLLVVNLHLDCFGEARNIQSHQELAEGCEGARQ